MREFEIKELRRLKYFLCIEVAYSAQNIFISQQKYVMNLLMEIRKGKCKLALVPIDPHKNLEESKEEPVNREMCWRMVGRLIYLAHTQLDIAYLSVY